MSIKARLRQIERRLRPRPALNPLQVHVVHGDTLEEIDAEVERLKKEAGLDGGPAAFIPAAFCPDVFIKVIRTPKREALAMAPDNGKGDMTAGIEDEIKRLERRKRELRKARAKA